MVALPSVCQHPACFFSFHTFLSLLLGTCTGISWLLSSQAVLIFWFQVYIELDLRYQPPEGSAGTWVEEDFVYQMKDRY